MAIAVVCLLGTGIACGDEPPAAADSTIRVNANSANVSAYMPERWSELRVGVTNPTTEPVSVFCVTFFDQNPNLQFGRRMWVPPHSRLRTWQPIRVPTPANPDERLLSLRTFVVREGDAESNLIPQQSGALQFEHAIRVDDRQRIVAVADQLPDAEPGRISVSDMLIVGRADSNQSRVPNFAPERLLTSTEEGLDGVDHLVIADSRLTSDPAGINAVRSWLIGGGRVWVMLDRVDPRVLELLLGDRFSGQIVDRVGLTEVRLHSDLPGVIDSTEPVAYEKPVEHVRMLLDGFETVYSVNGWPAAVTKPVGHGLLLVTTLGCDGWVRPRLPADPRSPIVEAQEIPFIALDSLGYLCAEFFKPRAASPMTPAMTEEHLRGYIGYSIPPRWFVLGTLLGFTVALGGTGVWCSRRGQLEMLGLIGPAVALAAGTALVAAGHRQRNAIPATTAVVEFVQPVAGTNQVRASGTAGLFHPNAAACTVQGSHEGWGLPDASGFEQTIRRMVWTDHGRWHWENLPASPSLRFTPFRATYSLSQPVHSSLTFDNHGAAGQLSLPNGLSPTDGILVTPTGRIGVEFHPGGEWSASAKHVLTPEQFLAADVLNDEQHRRLQTLKSFFAGQDGRALAMEPWLLFWTKPWDDGLQFTEGAEQVGAALVALPVSVERPAANSLITIPSPLLPYREAYGPDGSVPQGIYEHRRRQWNERSRPTASWFQFQIPPPLLPIEMKSARMTLRVTGPAGKLEVAGFANGQVVPLKTWKDPIGTLSIELSDPQVLSVNAQGRLTLRLAIGDPDRPELTQSADNASETLSYWRIESLDLELTAQVLEVSQPSPP